MTFEPGKEYKTRDGRRARVYAVDGGGVFTIHGALAQNGKWVPRSWRRNGSVHEFRGTFDNSCDLMPPEPEKITRWVIVYDGGEGVIWLSAGWPSRESALSEARKSCTLPAAIAPITFHRGEGLE